MPNQVSVLKQVEKTTTVLDRLNKFREQIPSLTTDEIVEFYADFKPYEKVTEEIVKDLRAELLKREPDSVDAKGNKVFKNKIKIEKRIKVTASIEKAQKVLPNEDLNLILKRKITIENADEFLNLLKQLIPEEQVNNLLKSMIIEESIDDKKLEALVTLGKITKEQLEKITEVTETPVVKILK